MHLIDNAQSLIRRVFVFVPDRALLHFVHLHSFQHMMMVGLYDIITYGILAPMAPYP